MAYNTLGPWRVENLGTENKMCVTNTSWCFLLDNSLWLGSCEVLGRGPIHFRQRAIRIGVHGHGGGTGSKPCSLLGLLENFFRNNKTPTPFRYLTKLSMFIRSGGKYPKLRGKASEIRPFGKALLALWNQFSNQALLLHRRIALMLKHNVHLEDMITHHKEDFSLPPGPAQEFEETANGMLLLLTQIADHFVEEGLKVFDITSKSHMLQELAILSRCINPKVIWCFMGEDQMQRMQQIAKACVRGNKVDQQTSKLARHYRLALHLHFLDLAHWTWKKTSEMISKLMRHRMHPLVYSQFGGNLSAPRKTLTCSVLLIVVWDHGLMDMYEKNEHLILRKDCI